MEIEAKFRVPNREVHRELLRLRNIAGYTIVRLKRVDVVDRYLDAADGRLLTAKYSCRLRTQDGQVIATLKGLGSADDGIHHRDEREVVLPALGRADADALPLDPAGWPPSGARDLALELTDGAPLQPLFDLHQSRVKANLMDGTRRVAEWSVDEVRAVVGQRPAFYYELEIELGPEGNESDLARVAEALQSEAGLTPEPCSKFMRGLDMLRLRGTAVEGGVSDDERRQLEAHRAGRDPELARRAGAVLAWADGLPTREIVARTGLSSGRVRFWLREFRAKRMGIFAAGGADEETAAPPETPVTIAHAPAESRQVLPRTKPRRARAKTGGPQGEMQEASPTKTPTRGGSASGGAAGSAAPRGASPAPADAATPAVRPAAGWDQPGGKKGKAAAKEGLPTVADFCHLHGVQLPRARYVADNALVLFDMLRKIHALPRKRRKLLRTAALLATIGATQDSAEPERAGRDLILAQPLHGVSTEDRLALACIVALQREKMKPNKEPALEALEPKQRKEAVILASLLQVASALAYHAGEGTRIVDPKCDPGPDGCEVVLEGPKAAEDARSANNRAQHWRKHLKHDLRFVAAQRGPAPTAPAQVAAASEAATPAVTESAPAAEPASAVPTLPPVVPDDPMAEAGRKVMFTHFMKMLANEDGTRDGEDIEFLHDMRVATRRLRAAYRIFEPFYDRDAVAKFNKELRKAGGTLGAVRDLDVLIEKGQTYEESQAPEDGATGADLTLGPLLAHWGDQRDTARRALLDYLDSSGYRRFVENFRTFLLTPGMGAKPIEPGAPVAHQVRHIIPRLVMERYEQVRAYEAVLATAPITTYHMLRIDCKRLRYALEFFSSLLGPGAAEVIKQVTAMQELLGGMQDAHVAEGLIVEFLTEHRSRKKAEPLPGVEAYLLTQQHIQADLLGLFDAPWAKLTGPDFRRSLGLALATP